MTEPAETCPNCGVARLGRYCHACGQDNRRRTLRLDDAVADAFEALTAFDSRLVRTVMGLSRRPGDLVRRYVDGQRVRFVAPFRYALATCAVWWLSVAWQLVDVDMAKLPPGLRVSLSYGQLINLLIVPVLALLQRLVFLGAGRGCLAHVAFCFHVIGHVFLWRAGLALVGKLAPQMGPVLNFADGMAFVAYTSWALADFFRPAIWSWRTVLPLSVRIAATQVAILYCSSHGMRLVLGWLVAT